MTLSDFLEAAAQEFPGRVSPKTVSKVRESEAAAQRVEIHDDFFVTVHPVEQRLNLLELSPYAFEHLIRQLFEAMGYTAVVTDRSKNAGFDIDAALSLPTGPIRTLVAVKRYRHAVSPSDIRALWGVMMHERAENGIIVTTSWFPRSAIRFSEGEALRLIDGQELVGLLREHLGINATIS
jgi:restriction system protein